jgi:hypothetical protein
MTAPSQEVDLGPVLANNVAPTAKPGGPYSGVEGTAITFNGTGSTSVCGFNNLTLEWKFSDGGVAYGPEPQHTFEAPGHYSGELIATDADGNVGTGTFSVNVEDVPPVVHAGPAMSSEWGVPVTLNGSATDPGTEQQPFLTYSWTFGDGSPSASGGGSVSHVYAAPGTYTPTLKVCDPENECGQSSTSVSVSQRSSVLSYTGVLASDVTDPAQLKASLIDDQGQPIVGRTVSFYADGSTTPFATAASDSSGNVAASYPFPLGSVGTHAITAKFAGDTLYKSSQFSVSFSISQDGTVLTYTGPTSSNPSRPVSLTANLTDDTGRAVAGRTVQFTLGTQGCSGVTSSAGIANCTIPKLEQKPGNYLLTGAFAGSADYLGSSTTVGFTVGK